MKIAFLGTGAMGVRMAAHLLYAKHEVRVWNRDPSKAQALAARGAVMAASPRIAAAGVDAVLAMVRDDSASRAVWLDSTDGALPAMAEGAMAIECSTLSIAWARNWAKIASDRQLRALDAPVIGSRPHAEAGQLMFLAGGDAALVERATPLLRTMGAAVHHCGIHGSGAALKLAVNALFVTQVTAIAELFGMLCGNGLDLARAMEVISALPVASPAATAAMKAMVSGNFAPQYPLALVAKDFGYIAAAAQSGGYPAPVTAAVGKVIQQATERGWGTDNLTGVARLYR